MQFSSVFKIFRRPLGALGAAVRDFSNHDDRVARRSLDIVREIAADVVGSDTIHVESAFLSGRNPKGGPLPLSKLYVHSVSRPDGSRWAIIEKRSNSLRELSAYQRAVSAVGAILPKVYRIQRNSPLGFFEYRHHVYLEMLPTTGFGELSSAAAVRLARHMIKVADIPMSQPEKLVRRRPGELTGAFLKMVASEPSLREFATDELLSALPALSQNLRDREVLAAPVVTCHNDLHPRNVGLREDGSMAFFDWEQMGPNHLGSDLHHFIASGLAHPDQWARFTAVLCDEYAKLGEEAFGVSQADVAVAANTYCIYRGMDRALRHREPAAARSVMSLLDRVHQGGLESFPDFGASAAEKLVSGA